MADYYSKNRIFILSFLFITTCNNFIYAQQNQILKTYENISPANIDDKILQMSSSLKQNKIIEYTLPTDSVPVFNDLIYEIRITKLSLTIPITLDYNQTVKKYIDFYTIKKRELISKMLGMSQYYFPLFESALDRYHLPLELKYLAIVESALNPTARSKSGAVGLWQFLLPTAQMLDLKITSFIDERQDPVKSTEAACRYLEYLYNTFKDWQLVLAAYNGGPGVVRNAIIRSGGKTDFWELCPYLPPETQGYVPAFIALTYIMNYPVEHNIHPDVSKLFYYQVDTVMINQPLYFTSVANALKIPLETIRFLNPAYKTNYIPKSDEYVSLVLPANKISTFISNQRTILCYSFPSDTISEIKTCSADESRTLITYIVKKGDYLNKLALKYHCSVKEIMEWNNLTVFSLTTGSILKIWAPDNMASSMIDISDNETIIQKSFTQKSVVYTVQEGDTLYSISQKFTGTTVAEIMQLNQLSKESALVPGTQLKINIF
ncbi:MAG: lytic transglycosylase [Bacteroidetes bacterium CG23_combo_of_CG06-09_8_20_14_all_32_9]|nr:MAG: lytic transglycosylase [Bacteroidetes bacterium CG23_combo_of_CG06-09_8_20_14_all_32_9]